MLRQYTTLGSVTVSTRPQQIVIHVFRVSEVTVHRIVTNGRDQADDTSAPLRCIHLQWYRR